MARDYTPYGAPKKTGKGVALTVFKQNDDRRALGSGKKEPKIPSLLVPDHRNVWARESYNPVRDSYMGEMSAGRVSL